LKSLENLKTIQDHQHETLMDSLDHERVGVYETDLHSSDYKSFGSGKYYTVQHVAEKLGVSPNTVRNWTDALVSFIQCEYDKHGQRLFTEEHIEKLKYIHQLRSEYGIPLKTIQIILDSVPKRPTQPITTSPASMELRKDSKQLATLSNELEQLSNTVKMLVEIFNQNMRLADQQTQQIFTVTRQLEETSNQLQRMESTLTKQLENTSKRLQQTEEWYEKTQEYVHKKLDEQTELLKRQADLVSSLRKSMQERQEQEKKHRKGVGSLIKNLFTGGSHR
jgi:DNA-binding transcriptional MerR regulator